MKSDPNIDELLCSFIDGELPPRQKTEVQRLAARDPKVGQRLRQLQSCRDLISVLPKAEAPDGMLEQIRQSLERRTLLGDRPVSSPGRAGAWHLRIRHLTAAAAMIALVGVLGVVVYQIVAPVAPVEEPSLFTNAEGVAEVTPGSPGTTATLVSDSGFTGRLELQTAAFVRADAFVKEAIMENGLSDFVEPETAGNKTTYRITAGRESLNRLVADLNTVWQASKSATLVVQTDRFAEPVVVKSVTPQQATKIIGQDNAEACAKAAREVAVLNSFAQDMPGQNVVAMANNSLDATGPVPMIPRPKFTSGESTAKTASPLPEGEVKASLEIVLLNTP
jgi:hypothetical protein